MKTFIFKGFKEELFGHILKFTEDFESALETAKESDPSAQILQNLIQNHENGPFRQEKVFNISSQNCSCHFFY